MSDEPEVMADSARELVESGAMTDLMEEARAAVSSIFDDLRSRRFLKWLFKSEPSVIGDFPNLTSLDLEVQDEIRDAWAGIIASALAAAEQRGREEERERWKPAATYFDRYCQDEAEDVEHCVCGEQQHEDAKAFAAAIRRGEP